MGLPESAVTHSDIVVGRFGEEQMLRGWHERERDGRYGIPYRSSTDDGMLVLRRRPNTGKLWVLISGPVALHGGNMAGYLIIDRQKYELPLTADIWALRDFPIISDDPILRVRLYLRSPIVPDRLLHNGDARQLGWYLSAVWQE